MGVVGVKEEFRNYTFHKGDSIHRLDGPAIVHHDETHEWYFNGGMHRLDGPAFIKTNGECEWLLKGVSTDQK